MDKVSIIVPVYNSEKYLAETLDCLINQTYKNIEIICINDGSTDKSLEIMNEYAKKDHRIKVFSQENKGEAETRKIGNILATGEYVTALDSDDVCSLNTIESSVEIAKKNNSDIVINYLNLRLNLERKEPRDFAYIATWQMFVKNELLKANSDIQYNKNLKMSPDAIFTHKILGLTDKISINPLSIIYYRRHENQISSNIENQPEKLLQNIRLWFEDITSFYTQRNWWKTHNCHFVNYLCEQPFTSYIRVNWSPKQKEEIFNLIHSTVDKYNIIVEFNKQDKRTKLFTKFMQCKTYRQFELLWFLAHFYSKYTDYKKITQSKSMFDDIEKSKKRKDNAI